MRFNSCQFAAASNSARPVVIQSNRTIRWDIWEPHCQALGAHVENWAEVWELLGVNSVDAAAPGSTLQLALSEGLKFFQALVTSKVMYSLNSAWLNKAERKRLDGFQARCLRRILHIPHACVSRVSNEHAPLQSGQQPYTVQ
eukprot:2321958-Pyramimonas_sp.AAC.1